MFHFKDRPYNLLLMTAVIILFASFFSDDISLDIHMHKFYFIISLKHILGIIIILLLLFRTFYLLTTPILYSKVLTWSHIILMVLTSLSFVTVSLYSTDYYQEFVKMPGRYYDYGNWESTIRSFDLEMAVVIIFLIMCLGIFMCITNLTAGVIKKITSRRKQ